MFQSFSKDKLKTMSVNNLHGFASLLKENTLHESLYVFLLHWEKLNHFIVRDIDSTEILHLLRNRQSEKKIK